MPELKEIRKVMLLIPERMFFYPLLVSEKAPRLMTLLNITTTMCMVIYEKTLFF